MLHDKKKVVYALSGAFYLQKYLNHLAEEGMHKQSELSGPASAE